MGDALSWTRDRVMDNKWRGKKASVTCRQKKKKKRTSGRFNRCSHIWRSVCADRSLRGKRPPQQQQQRGRSESDDRPGRRPAGGRGRGRGERARLSSTEAAFFLPAFANVTFSNWTPPVCAGDHVADGERARFRNARRTGRKPLVGG